jgi:hypothetical protein
MSGHEDLRSMRPDVRAGFDDAGEQDGTHGSVSTCVLTGRAVCLPL